jgi:hypothetical protein
MPRHIRTADRVLLWAGGLLLLAALVAVDCAPMASVSCRTARARPISLLPPREATLGRTQPKDGRSSRD